MPPVAPPIDHHKTHVLTILGLILIAVIVGVYFSLGAPHEEEKKVVAPVVTPAETIKTLTPAPEAKPARPATTTATKALTAPPQKESPKPIPPSTLESLTAPSK